MVYLEDFQNEYLLQRSQGYITLQWWSSEKCQRASAVLKRTKSVFSNFYLE